MKIFDGHLHTFRFKVSVRESIDLFKRQFDRFNIEKGTFLALPCDPVVGRAGLEITDHSDNIKCMYFKSVFAPNFYAYAGLEYDHLDISDKKAVADDLLRQVKEYKAVGFDGMKMYEGHPNLRKTTDYALYDEVFDKYYDWCEKEGFPIIMHLANPPYMWIEDMVDPYWRSRGCYFNPEIFPKFEDFHEEILKRLEKNPKLNFTLAHWGFMTFNKEAMERFMSFENTKLDVCPGHDNFLQIDSDLAYWKPFIEKYADRITYGTDSYNFEYDNEESWYRATGNRPNLVQKYFATNETFEYGKFTFTGINLDKKVVDKIFYQNLVDMLGTPNAIDYDYFIKKCDELLEKADPESLSRYNLWCMKNDFITMKEKGELTYYKMLNR
ncbi:MAG: amidohydrolase family protein [Clostridia bacterium]|nr:amidohydrolase family protein [Clostridia bacterium]